jgi:hypothetical protein
MDDCSILKIGLENATPCIGGGWMPARAFGSEKVWEIWRDRKFLRNTFALKHRTKSQSEVIGHDGSA